MSTDAIVVLREDHKEIKRLFRSFEKAEKAGEKQKLVKQILQLLAVHTFIENEGMYPHVRKAVPDIESDILESYEEHHVADLLCAELAEMTPDDERFTAKVTVLIESVEHHIEEEESSWFPDVREALGRKQLQEIGAEMLKLRRKAPKQPKRMKVELVESKASASKPATKRAASKSTATKSAAAKSSTAKPSTSKAPTSKASTSKASTSKATVTKPPTTKRATNTATEAMVPAQADRESRPTLAPPPLPGTTGDIALLDASLPGAQTQDGQNQDGVRA